MDWLRHRITVSSYFLDIGAPPPPGSMNDPGSRPETVNRLMGLHLSCPLPERYFPSLLDDVRRPLLWLEGVPLRRGWLFLVVLAGSGAVVGLRRSLEARSLVVAGSTNTAVFAALGIGPGYRYLWFTLVCTLLTAGLALGRVPRLASLDRRQVPGELDARTSTPAAAAESAPPGDHDGHVPHDANAPSEESVPTTQDRKG